MAKRVIVTRHPAAVEFIRRTCPVFAHVPVIESATADDVANAEVAGNLPMHLAALADVVMAVEFDGPAPRGVEYTADDMAACGARLVPYIVTRL